MFLGTSGFESWTHSWNFCWSTWNIAAQLPQKYAQRLWLKSGVRKFWNGGCRVATIAAVGHIWLPQLSGKSESFIRSEIGKEFFVVPILPAATSTWWLDMTKYSRVWVQSIIHNLSGCRQSMSQAASSPTAKFVPRFKDWKAASAFRKDATDASLLLRICSLLGNAWLSCSFSTQSLQCWNQIRTRAC